jgi:hypothetical protein
MEISTVHLVGESQKEKLQLCGTACSYTELPFETHLGGPSTRSVKLSCCCLMMGLSLQLPLPRIRSPEILGRGAASPKFGTGRRTDQYGGPNISILWAVPVFFF